MDIDKALRDKHNRHDMVPAQNAAFDATLAFVEGNTWGGIPGISILTPTSPPAAAVSSAVMQFSELGQVNHLIALTTAGANIVITSAANWTFVVPSQTLNLSSGTYKWVFQTVDINGVILDYAMGSIQVLPRNTSPPT